jgi:uncharacterized protein (DUF488 family)
MGQSVTPPNGATAAYTIGHSKRSADELAELLRAWSIRIVADVRKMPRSRHNPQFNIDTLPQALASHGIRYVHLAALGGLRPKCADSKNDGWRLASFRNYADYAQTPEFLRGLDDLVGLIAEGPCAAMCAEVLWWRCHRRIISDYLIARGIDVIHLISATESERAVLTPFAEVNADKTLTYRAT